MDEPQFTITPEQLQWIRERQAGLLVEYHDGDVWFMALLGRDRSANRFATREDVRDGENVLQGLLTEAMVDFDTNPSPPIRMG